MQQKSKEEILKGKGIYQGFSSTYTWDGILAAMEEYGEEKSNEANEFIGDIAKLLGEDGLGFDDLTWTIDDFKNAINEYRSQPPHGTASGGYSLEDMKNAYDSGVTEGSNQSGSFEWGIRRKDIEFKEWLASEYPTQSETK